MNIKIQDLLEHKIIEFDSFHLSVWNIFFIVTVFVFVKLLFKIIQNVLRKRLVSRGQIEDGRLLSILQLIQYFIYIMAILISIKSIGIDITLLIGASAALLVGIGMGLQQTFNDIISGVIILFEGTLEIGDVVEVENIIGKVKEIRLRTCKIETRTSTIMIIPNSKFVTSSVYNWSNNQDTTLFTVNVGVAYGSNVDIVKNILLNCAKSHGEILKDPEPFVRFDNFGDSSLDFKLGFWTEKIWSVEFIKSDLRFMIDKQFRENKVVIPFPQRDLHIYKNDIQ